MPYPRMSGAERGTLRAMSVVPQIASVHPSTVTRVSEGKVALPKPQRRPVSDRPSRVTRLRVDPDLWAVAMAHAGGNGKRIQIISETEVWVR